MENKTIKRTVTHLLVCLSFVLLNGCEEKNAIDEAEDCKKLVDAVDNARAIFFASRTTANCDRVLAAYDELIVAKCPDEDPKDLLDEKNSFKKSFCP